MSDSTAAAVGALGATLALYPLDLAKTRIQAATDGEERRGPLGTCLAIAQKDGPGALSAL
ncbi:hypothetical protein T492DRAFT_874950 [Pavlovales sp. CCMP2436]|nr:hypothetical protein T492DRAFT_874950 [Pavlovales sp. CCMP2436]